MALSEYRKHPAISQSDVKMYMQSKLLYFQTRVAKTRWPASQTKSMKFGSDLEIAIKDGTDKFVKLPDDIKQRRGKKWEEFRDSLPEGSVVMTPKEYETIADMEDAISNIHAHPQAKKLIFGDEITWHQQLYWDCPKTGVKRKAELDVLHDDWMYVADLKTTEDPSPDAFAKQCQNLNYHLQAATYCQAVKTLYKTDPTFFHVAVRNKPPFNVEVYEMDIDWIKQGLKLNNLWLPRIRESYAEKDWQKTVTHDAPMTLEAPRWGKYQNEQLEEMYG